MSLRDELQPVRSGNKSRIDTWLEEQPQDFTTEFLELVNDHTVGHAQLFQVARKDRSADKQYSNVRPIDISIGAFSDWRKKQWDSKTN